jgi:signal peptidase II
MPSRLFPFSIAAAVFLLDRLTKSMIKAHVDAQQTVSVIPGCFNIVHAENPGVAFGLLAEATGAWRNIFLIGLSASVLVFISVLLWKPVKAAAPDLLLRIGLACILGGAFGNLYDRVVNGTVTDFVEVYAGTHYFPAFNVADSGISVGAGLLLLDMWRGRGKKIQPRVPSEERG